ncbi:TrmB family transcriptional regulator [Patescibacteria group bacterium]
MDELIRELQHLGLSEKEGAVYLASLELGPAPVQDISHKSKVNRATTYVMIESLTGRGLMSTFVKGKKRYYAPESPERLASILRLQKNEIEEKENELDKTLPLLLALYNVEGAKPQIRYLEGVEGIKTVRNIFEKQKGEFLQILPLDESRKITELTEGRVEHLRNVHSEKPPFRILFVVKDLDPNKLPDRKHGQMRIIPADKFPIHGEITIRENTIYLYSFKSSILSVVITSKELSDTVKALFNLAWEGAEKYTEK